MSTYAITYVDISIWDFRHFWSLDQMSTYSFEYVDISSSPSFCPKSKLYHFVCRHFHWPYVDISTFLTKVETLPFHMSTFICRHFMSYVDISLSHMSTYWFHLLVKTKVETLPFHMSNLICRPVYPYVDICISYVDIHFPIWPLLFQICFVVLSYVDICILHMSTYALL